MHECISAHTKRSIYNASFIFSDAFFCICTINLHASVRANNSMYALFAILTDFALPRPLMVSALWFRPTIFRGSSGISR